MLSDGQKWLLVIGVVALINHAPKAAEGLRMAYSMWHDGNAGHKERSVHRAKTASGREKKNMGHMMNGHTECQPGRLPVFQLLYSLYLKYIVSLNTTIFTSRWSVLLLQADV